MEKLYKTFQVAKGMQAPDGQLWGIVSKEIEDAEHDIVRIDGIHFDEFHDPAATPPRHMKILLNHDASTENIVGRVEEFARLTVNEDGQEVKLLAMRMSWAPGELAAATKELVDAGYLDSFSMGFIVEESQSKRPGLDITKSMLFECSLVAVPANPHARVIKQKLSPFIKNFGFEEEKEYPILHAKIDALKQGYDQLCTEMPKLQAEFPKLASEFPKLVSTLTESMRQLHLRLDVIEAALDAGSEPASEGSGSPKVQNQLKSLLAEANRLKRTLT